MAGVKSINKQTAVTSAVNASTNDNIPRGTSNGEGMFCEPAAVRRIGVATLDRANSGMRTVVLSAHTITVSGNTGAGLKYRTGNVVAQDMNSFERVCGRNNGTSVRGEGKWYQHKRSLSVVTRRVGGVGKPRCWNLIMGINAGDVVHSRGKCASPVMDGTVITGFVADRTTATLVVRC